MTEAQQIIVDAVTGWSGDDEIMPSFAPLLSLQGPDADDRAEDLTEAVIRDIQDAIRDRAKLAGYIG